MNEISNHKGLSLIELMVSILVASFIITLLLSILTMSLKAKATLDVENKLSNESTFISEKLKFNIFELQVQSIELVETTDSTIIYLTHEYDIMLDSNQVIYKDYTNPITHTLKYDKVTQQITYDYADGNGPQLLHDPNVIITYEDELSNVVSFVQLISFDTTVCDFNIAPYTCDQGIIKLTLTITVLFPNGAILVPKTYVTTIII